MNFKSYQNLAIMLNRGLSDELIEADEAVEILCTAMPLTFHKGEWSIKRKGGLMVLKKRLVAWFDCNNELDIYDVVELLQGN